MTGVHCENCKHFELMKVCLRCENHSEFEPKDAEKQRLSEIETIKAMRLVTEERKRQFSLYGDQSGKSPYEFLAILGEEYGELCEAVGETYTKGRHPERGGAEKIIKEAVHVAAVAIQFIEVMKRKENAE